MKDLRYPIGEFSMPPQLPLGERVAAIREIEKAPAMLREAVQDLNEAQLDTPYRPEGWTVRQVVHHLPDSHLNGYCRFKLALTENVPTIRTYEEAEWAKLPDVSGPIEPSLVLLEQLHARWVYLLNLMTESDWSRRLRHPEVGEVGVDQLLALYAWHGEHHVAHVTSLRERQGWFPANAERE